MLTHLGTVKLKKGEDLKVLLLMPLESGYSEKLLHFLEHKGEKSFRCIRQRLAGKYKLFATDKYFLGEVNGKLAGQVWYGYSEPGTGIANFGHVYTEPEHRGKGIANRLMEFFVADFWGGPARAALCTAGSLAARIYLKFGFKPIRQGADCGPLILLKDRADFRALANDYFAPGRPFDILPGDMRYRHDIDLVLKNELALRGASAQRLGKAFSVSSYQDACFLAEDGRGAAAVAATCEHQALGWSFVASVGAPEESGSPVFDFEAHPNYPEAVPALIRAALAWAGTCGFRNVYAFAAAGDEAKLAALHAGGFDETARLPEYLLVNGAADDLVLLRAGRAGFPEDRQK